MRWNRNGEENICGLRTLTNLTNLTEGQNRKCHAEGLIKFMFGDRQQRDDVIGDDQGGAT